MELREREEEQGRLRDALRAVAAGRGRLTVIEGEAGLGKTALIEWAAKAAQELDVSVVRARGGPLERDLPFGVVRASLGRLVARRDSASREALLAGAAGLAHGPLGLTGAPPGTETAVDSTGAALHGLYWLSSNLLESGPLLVVVDDAHWADEASLRWLLYMARRLEELPMGLLVATRPHGPAAHLVAEADVSTAGDVLRLEVLSLDACAAVIRSRVPDVRPQVCAALRRTSGGNPFLLGALVDELVRTGRSDLAEPATLTSDRIASWLVGRFPLLDGPVRRVADAVAVLGAVASLRLVAEMADVALGEAQHIADELAGTGLIAPGRPLTYRHPLLRTAVYDSMPPGARAAAHQRAARMLAREDAPADHVAGHLLVADPAGESWNVAMLERAARAALEEGAPHAAVRFMRRALDEPPPVADRPRVLRLLGQAEHLDHRPEAIEHLARAVEQEPSSKRAAEAFLELADAAAHAGVDGDRLQAAAERVRGELAVVGADLAFRAHLRMTDAQGLKELVTGPDVEALGPVARAETMAVRAMIRAGEGTGTASEAVADALAGLAEGSLLERESGLVLWFKAVEVLHNCDRFDLVAAETARAAAEARRRGSEPLFMWMSIIQAWDALNRGDLVTAEAAAGAVWDRRQRTVHGFFGTSFARATLVAVALARADTARARGLLAEPLDAAATLTPARIQTADAWAAVHVAERRWKEALAEATVIGDWLGQLIQGSPVGWPWWEQAVRALIGLERYGDARRLVEEQLTRWRAFGAPLTLARALRAQALVRPGRSGLEALEEAVDLLRPTPARLLLAESLTDLGSALRRDGRPAAGRALLHEALELAEQCAATITIARATGELHATGGRRRRRVHSGAEALTPSEVRIARLAAQGLSNKEIAQSQFLSLKTVEMHLGRVYRKLDIGGRAGLATALPPEPAQAEQALSPAVP